MDKKSKTVLTWNLKEVMANEGILAKDLVEELGVHYRQVSRLRKNKSPGMPHEKIEDLLLALNLLKDPDRPLITPNDLWIFSLTVAELQQIESRKKKRSHKTKESINAKAQNGA